MKKFFSLIFFIFFFASNIFLFTGCNNNKFVEILKIEYTTNGVEKSELSHANIHVSSSQYATVEEYNLAEDKYKFYNNVPSGVPLEKSTKTVTSYNGFTEEDVGKMVYNRVLAWGTIGWGQIQGIDFDFIYLKYELTGFSYTYISVKIIDDDTIIIRNNQGETTYTVTSYRLTYFD